MTDHTQAHTTHEQKDGTASIRLTHAALMTKDLALAIDFYTSVLGLSLRVQEEDPIRTGHQRAMLCDTTGFDVIELIEYPNLQHASVPGHGAINHIGFKLPNRDWLALRSRLDASGYPYQEVEGRLFIRDADAVVLEVETGYVSN